MADSVAFVLAIGISIAIVLVAIGVLRGGRHERGWVFLIAFRKEDTLDQRGKVGVDTSEEAPDPND